MRFLSVLIFSILNSCFLAGQLSPQEIQIPMRDGKSLAADLYLPSQDSVYPIILIQTPYNRKSFRFRLPLGIGIDIQNSPYGVIVLDWRCFYGSVGACGGTASRGEDGYDAVEWIADQSWSNGKVATWGPSALGNVQFQTAKEQPTSLVCAIPLVAAPQVNYEQYYPGGIAEQAFLETLTFLFGPVINIYSQNTYDSFLWTAVEAASKYYDEINIPMLNIAGWFDHNIEECIENYQGLKTMSPSGNQHKLLIGPWVHGGVGPASTGTEYQGDLYFPEAAGYPDIIGRQFLDYHMLNAQNGWSDSPGIQYFLMGENIWKETELWPPSMLENHTLYLNSDYTMTTSPKENIGSVSYEYDPENPTPTKGGKTLHPDLEQGPYDISSIIESRNDVAVFTSQELQSELEVLGKIRSSLFFSSDRKDTDLIIKITDVYPDGRSVMLDESFLRLRFRKGFTANDESLLIPGEIYKVELEFDNLAHVFLKGHKIRLVVSSANYIRLNRNMNNGESLYPDGNLDTLNNPLIATNTIHTGMNFSSKIDLPVRTVLTSSTINYQEDNKFSIYPNPASDQIFISGTPGKSVSISDNTGKVLFNTILERENIDLNIQSWPPGVYWCNQKQFIISR